MLNILYFNHYHDSKILTFIYFVGLKCTGSHWSMRPNVKFQIGLPKTNPSLAKSLLQRKTRGYTQKLPLTKTNQTLIMETIFPIITKKVMFSNNNRNCIRNKVRKFKILFLTVHLTFYIYIYIYVCVCVCVYVCVCVNNFHILLLFENIMNNVTSHLMSLLCKSLVSKYIMVRSVINEIIKK